ncbi:hypothetical protein HDF16_005138 [Granulicella aggregans]|uniref:Uncharacterized protein n=1 Tax=Granulicella aggregans TaxID=474949 RepID=A0A7W7ZIE0_9BACT|nr:hypothetical protein [Granulicella aggregans]MBB5060402.1 hypothetical protein [Granulicella aggregans]
MIPFLFTNENEIYEIMSGLLDLTLPREKWTHAAHLASAVCALSIYSEEAAFEELARLISVYNEATGFHNTDSSGFHYTITKASLIAAKSVVECHKGKPLHLVTNSLVASRFGKSEWIFKFWSKEALFSPSARRTWVEPDVKPLPFE